MNPFNSPVLSAEKVILLSEPAQYLKVAKRQQQRSLRPWLVIVGILTFLWLASRSLPSLLAPSKGRDLPGGTEEEQVDFEDITPSEKLEWHPCYGEARCARLTVPMDYSRPLNASRNNPKVHIAMVLVPGKHDGPKKFSISPLLINPGGPGGPGTTFAAGLGRQLQKIVGLDQDVIGFDPRGIGATLPRTDCFSYPINGTSPATSSDYYGEDYMQGFLHRSTWKLAGREVGLVNSSSDSLRKLDNRARAISKLCQAKDSMNGNDSIFRHVSTPSVARDMISIIDAWDEWTESLTSKPIATLKHDEKSSQHKRSVADTKGKLVYWGFSYGTLLGATFASMFPDRVGRVVLDGVVDADHYVAPVWLESIRDADTILNSFSRYCHDAKGKCALYRKGDDIADVETRFRKALASLEEHPVTAIDPQSNSPVIITISDIRPIIFSVMYAPTQAFSALAIMINSFYEGQPDFLTPAFALPDAHFFCETPSPVYYFPNDAQYAIMCSDKRYPLNETSSNLNLLFEKMESVSSFADVWMSLMVGCNGWSIEAIDPPMRWDDHPAHKQKPIQTSFPLLFLSNTYDPVTPLSAGVKMAEKFKDAGLIEQRSMGHCSISSVSLCTIKKIGAYFQEGKVPPPPAEGQKGKELIDGKWDRCEADEWPFHPYDGSDWADMTGDFATMEVESMRAMKKIQEYFKEAMFWGQPSNTPLDGFYPL